MTWCAQEHAASDECVRDMVGATQVENQPRGCVEGSVAEEALDAVQGRCTRGLCFEVGAVDDGFGGGLVGVAHKQWWPISI